MLYTMATLPVIHFHLYLLIFQFFNPLIYRLRSLHAVGQTPALIVDEINTHQFIGPAISICLISFFIEKNNSIGNTQQTNCDCAVTDTLFDPYRIL